MRKYDIAVVGGGAGGLVVASVAAQLGLDVALVEKQRELGGDCLHYGCVPSKALLRTAHVAHTVRHAGHFGINVTTPRTDLNRVNAYIDRAVKTIQQHDSHERFRQLGCDLFEGSARFLGRDSIRAGDHEIYAKRFVIATGSSAWVPDIEGIDRVDYLTNEDMFSLDSLPDHLLVMGAGPVGVEMAQAFAQLGSRVTLVEQAQQILPGFDNDIAVVLKQQFLSDHIDIVHGRVAGVRQSGSDTTIRLDDGREFNGDRLLVAVGRRPVVDSLDLDKAGVDYDSKGIQVNARMQTSNRRIYACGDVTGLMPYTHVAEQQAGVVIANICFRIPKRMDYRVVPSVVYTAPECAQLGISTSEALHDSTASVVHFDMKQLDRAVVDGNDEGFLKLVVRRGRLVGAHAIGPHVGEVIHELALAIQRNMKLSSITTLIHAYPAYAQINRRAASQYYRDSLFSVRTRKLVQLLNRWLP